MSSSECHHLHDEGNDTLSVPAMIVSSLFIDEEAEMEVVASCMQFEQSKNCQHKFSINSTRSAKGLHTRFTNNVLGSLQ